MSETARKNIHLVCDIVLSVILALTGICLMTACLSIYLSGEKPFTPQSVTSAFRSISILVYHCLDLVIARFVLEAFIPRPRKKIAPKKQYDAILARLYQKTDIRQCAPQLQAEIRRIRMQRNVNKWVTLGLLSVCSLVFVIYAVNPHNFHQTDINGSMVKAVKLMLICMVIPFGFAVYAAYTRTAGLKKEIALVKEAAANHSAGKTSPAVGTDRAAIIVRYAILGIALAFLVYGFLSGGTNDVLTKAVNICTECVGLG